MSNLSFCVVNGGLPVSRFSLSREDVNFILNLLHFAGSTPAVCDPDQLFRLKITFAKLLNGFGLSV